MQARHRHVVVASVQYRAGRADPCARMPTLADTDALARLIHEAGQGGIDDEGETLDDTRAVVDQYMCGEFGPPLWSASEVTEREGRIVAAVLLSAWWGGPFVAFVATAPAWQRRGLARAALTRVIDGLAADGDPRASPVAQVGGEGRAPFVRLVVTEGNLPALALYGSLGFRPEMRRPFSSRGSRRAQPQPAPLTTA